MKKIFILLFIFLVTSCAGNQNSQIDNKKDNISIEKKELLSSPNGGGNTGELINDSFRN